MKTDNIDIEKLAQIYHEVAARKAIEYDPHIPVVSWDANTPLGKLNREMVIAGIIAVLNSLE